MRANPRVLLSLSDCVCPSKSTRRVGSSLVGERVELPKSESHHILDVLRQKAGDGIRVIDSESGRNYLAIIEPRGGKAVTAIIVEELGERKNTYENELCLLSGIGSLSSCDIIVEKCTEVGVNRIFFFRGERSQFGANRLRKRLDRFEKIVIAARKQSQSAICTEVFVSDSLETALEESRDPGAKARKDLTCTRLVFVPAKTRESTGRKRQVPVLIEYLCALRELRRASPKKDDDKLEKSVKNADSYLIVGPPGGLSDSEVGCALQAGYERASLGCNLLRTETAAVVAAAALRLFDAEELR